MTFRKNMIENKQSVLSFENAKLAQNQLKEFI